MVGLHRTEITLIRFQFQTGSIKSREAAETLIEAFDQFQFQTGAIKRRNSDDLMNIVLAFRFQTGAIRRKSSKTTLTL